MEINEDMALLVVKKQPTHFRIRKIIEEECQDHLHVGKPMNNIFLCCIYSSTSVGDCWFSNLSKKNLQHCKYLHKPKTLSIGHGQF
jgi:hypothetical protein